VRTKQQFNEIPYFDKANKARLKAAKALKIYETTKNRQDFDSKDVLRSIIFAILY